MPQVIALRYAQALFDLCEEKKNTEKVQSDLEYLLSFLQSSKELRLLLKDPVITSSVRLKILTEVFKEKLNESTFLYLLFLENKGRIDLIETICIAFQKIYLEAKKVLRVKITSSIDLDEQQIKNICEHLQPKFQREMISQVFVDPEILGGLKIQIEDKIYDHTLRGQLERFQKIL